MSRLQSEWRRLYLPQATADLTAATAADAPTGLISAKGEVRAMVLALARPADWTSVSAVWRAVQADLGLPAPAIAVSGVDAYQLWFSLEEAVSTREAHAFLESLRQRYLAEVAMARVELLPHVDTDTNTDTEAGSQSPGHGRHASLVPPQQIAVEQWSAFLAPDLAPMFAETPWLDIPPSPEGQAELLSGLKSIHRTDWRTALARLQEAQDPVRSASAPSSPIAAGPCLDPKRFLLDVMNDGSMGMALRIEAAKALLPYTDPRS